MYSCLQGIQGFKLESVFESLNYVNVDLHNNLFI